MIFVGGINKKIHLKTESKENFIFRFSGRSFVAPSLDASDRSFKPGEDHRTETLKTIENYLTGMGGVVKNGHACVLRAICEVRLLNINNICSNLERNGLIY